MPRDADYLTKQMGKHLDKSIYTIHRLDAKTSGIILCAFSRDFSSAMQQLFQKRDILKKYRAVVKGVPGSGTIDREVVIKHKKRRKDAVTHYTTIQSTPFDVESEEFNDLKLSEVEFQPVTGRWHQIRQHCAAMRNGIIGDVQHGNWTLNKLIPQEYEQRMYLHAHSLDFIHPLTQKEMHLEASVPESFYAFFDK